MSGIKNLNFDLLGSFSYEGQTLKAGRKVLSFLQYLIVYHERNISAEELIEKFWPEGSNAPANALRRMLFKTRNLLREMYPGQEELLLTFPGCYAWNPEICLKLDIEEFEAACQIARKKEGDEQAEAYLLAVSLYKGDFLAANDDEWAMGLRQYYRAIYLDACKMLLPLLEKRERWIDILSVCEQAYRIDFTVENFTICQMQALINLGQPEQAIKIYKNFRNKMLEEFQIEPSSHAEQLYTLASGLIKKEMGISDIFDILNEEDSEEKAFFCTFQMFRSIVTLERRHLSRSKGTSMLVVVKIGSGGVVPGTDMRRLERILLDGLRAGDPVARLEAGSYIVMLTGANKENAQLVMSRLDRAFHKTYRHSKARITYHMAKLSSEKN